ncbi:MAG: hypothetical protein H6730_07915 [Deltaproteobacteria bacterium]|nr:hypothetical protein [Deltaproteobacteria bacterium]
MKTLGLAAFTSLSLGLVACGGDPIDQIREDFQNPSGSTSNKEGVMAAQAQRDGANPVMGIAGAGIPGAALTAEGKTRALEQVSATAWAPKALNMIRAARAAAKGSKQSFLTSAQFAGAGCSDDMAAQQAYEEIWQELILDAAFGVGAASGDASYTLDVSSCSDGELTGSMTVEIKISISDEETKFEVKQTMDICEVGGAEACVNGETVMRATASGTSSETEAAEILAYWDVSGTWHEDASTYSAQLKGGVRITATSGTAGDTAGIEYLFYVKAPDGEEYSYVFSISATNVGGMGTVSWTIRGADGEITCTATETEVSCTGTADFTYTGAEAAAVADDWFGS